MTEPAKTAATDDTIPVLPVRDVVVYPHMVQPLFVGREKSILALDQAMKADPRRIVVLSQRQPDIDDPKPDDLYRFGTIATVLQLVKLPDGTVKVLVEGVERASVDELHGGDYYTAKVTAQADVEQYDEKEMDVLTRSVISQFEQYVKLNKKVPPEMLTALAGIEQPGRLADSVAAQMTLKHAEKQQVLEILDVRKRLEHILVAIEGEMDVLQIEKRIRGRVKAQMEKSQREYYLNEQMKAIHKELGEMDEGGNEINELEAKIAKAGMPKEARDKATAELNKLKMMSPMSAEATVVRNYIDWLVKVPWKKRSRVHKDIVKAQKVLDQDHYGLEKVKERIVEYLAVLQRVDKIKGPILCLVGPPGVGKTSLGQSIARATNRKFVRMSLGGVRDEAEIRGHRRTYIGSMPGKVIQNMTKSGTHNPLFLLDEVDKMAMDFRGDPSSALLEVLDPEQNSAFNDHYLEVDFDLSEVMFICTANSMNIPAPLLDRMEVIRLPGYTEDEKVNIARALPGAQADQGQWPQGRRTQDHRRGAARHRALLHARGRRAQPGTRDRQDRRKAVKGLLIEKKKGATVVGHVQDAGQIPGRAPLPLRRGRRSRPRGPCHGPCVDRSGRRTAVHRDRGAAGQGPSHLHRQARRRDEGIHPGRHDRGAQPQRRAGPRQGFLLQHRLPRAPARGRDAQGWSIGRHRHLHGHGVGADQDPGAFRRGHDRRNHAAR